MTEHFKDELFWFRAKTRLKKGFQNCLCIKIQMRISWDWIKADTKYKKARKEILLQAPMHVSDEELEKFLLNQKIRIT